MEKPSAYDKQLHDKACLYFMSNYDELMAICMKAARDKDLAEELMSDVVLARLPRVIELWEANKPLRNYVNTTMRWYVLKELVRNRKIRMRESNALSEWFSSESIAPDDPLIKSMKERLGYTDSCEKNIEDIDSVESILSCLDELERQLVLLHVVHGYNYSQLSEMANISRTRASKTIKAALEKMREFIYERS